LVYNFKIKGSKVQVTGNENVKIGFDACLLT